MISLKGICTAAAAAVSLAGLAGGASAEVLNSSYYTGNWSFETATAAVPLGRANDGSAKTVIKVKPPAKGLYSLTYSAECSVEAPANNDYAWVDIDVIINGVAIQPTLGSNDAFCSADGSVGFSGWHRASITLAVPLKAGTNEITIQARLISGATGGWLGDSALVIDD